MEEDLPWPWIDPENRVLLFELVDWPGYIINADKHDEFLSLLTA